MITVQLGQCGQQLGCSFFQSIATEFAGQDYGRPALEQWFRPVPLRVEPSQMPYGPAQPPPPSSSHAARAVLIDMEPKVVQAVKHTARATGGWWRYPPRSALCMDSGAGNNWAHGYHGYGPHVREGALDLVRREVEACDMLNGFLLLQSMAGGTGAGVGTYVASALRDEYPSAHMLNCCVWPYESGEVLVQSYNTLLTLSHLHSVSDGIITLENDALHRCCNRLINIPRPSFMDMNSVAARSLAAALLPSTQRPPTPSHLSAHTRGSTPPGRAPVSTHPAGQLHRTQGSAPASGRPSSLRRQGQGSDGMAAPSSAGAARGGSGMRPVHLSDIVTQLCCHPMYRMLSLRAVPQVPSSSIDFTTFTWPAITKRLRQMLITGSPLEEGLDWGVGIHRSHPGHPAGSHSGMHGGPAGHLPTPHQQQQHAAPSPRSPPPPSPAAGAAKGSPASGSPGSCPPLPRSRHVTKSLANWLVLRGQGSGEVDVGGLFDDPGLYPWWAVDPLRVSSHPAPFAKCAMSAAALSNDQSCVAPMERMLERAYGMLASRAYVHQYEKYGMTAQDFHACFAQVEDIAGRYRLL